MQMKGARRMCSLELVLPVLLHIIIIYHDIQIGAAKRDLLIFSPPLSVEKVMALFPAVILSINLFSNTCLAPLATLIFSEFSHLCCY